MHHLGVYFELIYLHERLGTITIDEPVDYMARAVMILMWGKDIMRAIGRVGPQKVKTFMAQPFQWPKVMSLPCSKTIRGKQYI